MKLQKGKNCRTADGRKVVGVQLDAHVTGQTRFSWNGEILNPGESSEHWSFAEDGRAYAHDGYDPNRTIVAEWSDPEPATKAIDFSKIGVGDEIEVRLKVQSFFRGSPVSNGISFLPTEIVRHIPAPRLIEVGCRVQSFSSYPEMARQWTVVHIHQGRAWVENGDVFAVLPLSDLSRLDDGAAP